MVKLRRTQQQASAAPSSLFHQQLLVPTFDREVRVGRDDNHNATPTASADNNNNNNNDGNNSPRSQSTAATSTRLSSTSSSSSQCRVSSQQHGDDDDNSIRMKDKKRNNNKNRLLSPHHNNNDCCNNSSYCKTGNRSAIFWITITLIAIMVASTVNEVDTLQQQIQNQMLQPTRQHTNNNNKKKKKSSSSSSSSYYRNNQKKKSTTAIMLQEEEDEEIFSPKLAQTFFHLHDEPYMYYQPSSAGKTTDMYDGLQSVYIQTPYEGGRASSTTTSIRPREQEYYTSNQLEYEIYRKKVLHDMDDRHTHDDRGYDSIQYMYNEDIQDLSLEDDMENCRRVSWYTDTYPNCNTLHELVTLERPFGVENVVEQEYNITYLSKGGAREAWKFERYVLERSSDYDSGSSDDDSEDTSNDDDSRGKAFDKLSYVYDSVVLKRLRYKKSHNFHDLAKGRIENVIFNQLSSSPLVMDMYGYCGGSMILETMMSVLTPKVVNEVTDGQYSQSKLNQFENPCLNNLTNIEKLSISIDMAESLAAMHGNVNGRIIHSDVHIEQWLFDLPSGGQRVKLNDFDNSYLPMWDETKQEYCNRRKVVYPGIVSMILICKRFC